MKISASFDASSGGDVIFQSSDEVRFYVHKDALGYASGGFPLGDMVIVDKEPVPLTETSAVLEILFQFVYPRKQPGLDDIDFSLLVAVAEAAEKYELYSAMNLCQSRMKEYVPRYASQVFAFAGKHDYPYLIASVAPSLLGKPLKEVVPILPSHLLIPWCLYCERWERCLTKCLSLHSVLPQCSTGVNQTRVKFGKFVAERHDVNWYQTILQIQSELAKDRTYLQKLDTLFEISGSNQQLCANIGCSAKFDEWKGAMKREVASVPSFLTFWKEYKTNIASIV